MSSHDEENARFTVRKDVGSRDVMENTPVGSSPWYAFKLGPKRIGQLKDIERRLILAGAAMQVEDWRAAVKETGVPMDDAVTVLRWWLDSRLLELEGGGSVLDARLNDRGADMACRMAAGEVRL